MWGPYETPVIRNLLVIALLVVVLPVTGVPQSSDAALRVACNLPLTGPFATYGAAVRDGITFALSELGSADRLSFDWEDNQSEAKHAVSAASKQLRDSPQIYVSGIKPQYMAIREKVVALGIPHFVWIFDMNVRPAHEANFRTYVNFRAEVPLIVDYARQRRPKRIAIVYVQLPHTEEAYQQNLLPSLRAAGFSDVRVEPYQWDLNDFKGLAARIKSYDPELLFLSGFKENLLNLIPSFHQLGLIRGENTIVTYDMLDTAAELAPHQIEGIRVTSPNFVLKRNQEPLLSWNQRFERRFGKAALYTHAYAYDMTAILVDVAKRVGRGGSQSALRDAIQKTDLIGITGPLRFDEFGDVPASVSLGVIRDGHVEAAG